MKFPISEKMSDLSSTTSNNVAFDHVRLPRGHSLAKCPSLLQLKQAVLQVTLSMLATLLQYWLCWNCPLWNCPRFLSHPLWKALFCPRSIGTGRLLYDGGAILELNELGGSDDCPPLLGGKHWLNI